MNRVGAGVPTGGEFASQNRPESGVALGAVAPTPLTSEFIDGSDQTREAAAIFQAANPEATAEEFEDSLFDTYTDEEYEHDLAREDSELRALSAQLVVQPLPSGGQAVFFG
tara:strand:- start:8186 stop:8518 length:333 start_codon:yes stop_codon:yes gene_type:complete